MEKSSNKIIKKIVYWLILVGFVYLITKNLADLEQILTIIKEGNHLLIIFAVLLQLFFTFFLVESLRATLDVVGLNSRFLKVASEFISFNFVSVVTPLGTSAAIVYFAKKISERTYMGIAGSLLVLYVPFIISGLIFCLLNLVSIIYLEIIGFRGVSPIVVATIILIGQQLIFIFLYYLSVKRPVQLKKIVFDLRDLAGTIGGRLTPGFFKYSEDKITELLDDFNLSSHIFQENVEMWDLVKISVHGIISTFCQFMLLYILFVAFGVDVSFWQVFTGFSIIYLFTVVSPTPSGIGVVEGIAQLLFVGIGIPRDVAVVITFAFRGITVWFPMLIGFFAFRYESKGGL